MKLMDDMDSRLGQCGGRSEINGEILYSTIRVQVDLQVAYSITPTLQSASDERIHLPLPKDRHKSLPPLRHPLLGK